MKRITSLLLAMALVAAAGSAWASGFRIPEQGATAMGMANAWVAQADDPTAVFMNPAGIVQLNKPSVDAGFLAITPKVTHTDLQGKSTDAEKNNFVVPDIYLTDNMMTTDWAFGIGLSYPFGLGTEWSDTSFARYLSTKTEIQLMNINPTLAYKVSEAFLIGVGADYYRSNVTMKKMVPWGALTYQQTHDPAALQIPDGKFSLKGDGDGWGFNTGILIKIGQAVNIGAAYRSQVKVDYDGDANLTGIGGVGSVLYGAASYTSGGSATITYPATAQAGVAWKIVPSFLLEFDVDWTDWSVYDELKLKFDKPKGVLPAEQKYKKDWEDAFCYRLGADWKITPAMSLRFGALYDNSPVPDEHYDTLLPDGKYRYGGTLGFGYKAGSFSLDAAYLGLVLAKRTIEANNPEYPLTDIRGDYKGFTHMFSLNASYLF